MGTKLDKITIHWTVGQYKPNAHEKECYHFLVDGDGNIVAGNHKPEDNINCQDGNYAAHCGGGNSKNLGISICSMLGYQSPKNVGPCPITAKQFEACCKKCAELCIKYDIKINKDHVFTHMEFGQTHPNTTSGKKIDISYLPCHPEVEKNKIGDFFRNKILWYYYKLKG